MDRSVKIAVALSVLLGGAVVALLFRRELPQTDSQVPQANQRLVLRNHAGLPAESQTNPEEPFSRPEPSDVLPVAPPTGPQVTVVRPAESREPPPLAKSYPDSGVPDRSGSEGDRWGASIGLNLPQLFRPAGPPTTHKIVDGDSLESLAERYLGSAERCLEIYEANRDVLRSPQLLPIGVELKIPPRSGPSRTGPSATIDRPLVPVVP